MRRAWIALSCLTAALLGGLMPSARAQTTLSAAQILQQFNAVIFQNFTSSADVEGRTVVGGNMTGGATFALNPTAEAASSFAALTIYGNETGSGTLNLDNGKGATIAGSNAASLNLNGGGSVFVGGSNSGSIGSTGSSAGVSVVGSNTGQISLSNGGSIYVGSTNSANLSINGGSTSTNAVSINGNNNGYVTVNNGGTVKINGSLGSGTLNGGSLTYKSGKLSSWNHNNVTTHVGSSSLPAPSSGLADFATTFQAPLTALSSQLAALTPNSTVLTSGNNVTLVAHPNAQGQAVLNITTAVFQPNDSVSVALNGATSFIINLSVAGCSSNCSYTFANSINFQSPTSYADSVLWNVTNVNSLTFTNEFGGTVLAPTAVVTNGGPIDGSLVALGFNGHGELHDYSFTGALPAPEPSSLAVMAVGLAGAGWLRRRKRAVRP